MPVAVDRTHDMGVFVDKGTVGDVQAQDIAQVDSPKKVKMRKPKRTERQQQQPVAGSSSEQAADDGTTWAWRSLTESSASRVTPVFTKDGRYVLFGGVLEGDLGSSHRRKLFHDRRWSLGQDLLCRDWACGVDTVACEYV